MGLAHLWVGFNLIMRKPNMSPIPSSSMIPFFFSLPQSQKDETAEKDSFCPKKFDFLYFKTDNIHHFDPLSPKTSNGRFLSIHSNLDSPH